MRNLRRRIQQYLHIFQGVSIPWVMLVVVLLLNIVNTYLDLLTVTLTANIIDGSQQAINLQQLVQYIVVMVSTAAMSMVMGYTQNWTYEKINTRVRVKMWNKLMRLPTSYYDREGGDELVSRITTDCSQVSVYFQIAINLVTAVYAAVIAIRQMLDYSPVLTKYAMVIIFPLIVIAGTLGCVNRIAGQKTQATFASTTGFLVELTRNLRLVKASRTEDYEEKRGKDYFQKQFRASWWAVGVNSSTVLLMELVNVLSIAVTFFVGRSLVNAGEITVAKLLGFYTISGMMGVRFITLMGSYSTIKNANGRLEKISEVLDTADETRDGVEFDVFDADLVGKDIAFAYGGEQNALDHVSFRIPKGEITAIVGSNGAGKSTLFKLFERMYDPDSGVLYFGDDDVRKFELDSWRRSFAIVSQDKPLLSGTVRENILYGVKRKVSEEEFIRVTKLANVYDFVMATPGGFDAPVGMGGGNFSGGQRQCIAIARAMMRNPDYLLLDEATASLDAKSEQLVSEALTNLMKGRTTIMIAHSYPATRGATHVIVMRDGKVEAEGSPEEVLETNEYYRSFAAKAS